MAEAVAFGEAADVESAIRRLLAQVISFEEFTDIFLSGRLWFRKGAEVGFRALGAPGDGYVPIYTSDAALARAEGACDWVSTTGLDLFRLLPAGYGFIVDRGSETELYVIRIEKAAA